MGGVAGPIDHTWGLGDARTIAAAAAASSGGGGEGIVAAVSRVNKRGGEMRSINWDHMHWFECPP